MAKATVTRPSRLTPFSMTLKVPYQRRPHASRPAGIAQIGKCTPVASSAATAMPPSSAAMTSTETRNTSTRGTRKKWKPKRSRMASGMVCLLTAAKRPDISTSRITQRVPRTIAHTSW
jgi:hypothetical protein